VEVGDWWPPHRSFYVLLWRGRRKIRKELYFRFLLGLGLHRSRRTRRNRLALKNGQRTEKGGELWANQGLHRLGGKALPGGASEKSLYKKEKPFQQKATGVPLRLGKQIHRRAWGKKGSNGVKEPQDEGGGGEKKKKPQRFS